MGLGGIYLNLKGREGQGIVAPGQGKAELKRRLIEGLEKLVDPERGVSPIRKVYDTDQFYSGPYVADAPDLIVGFRPGYRVSWESAQGAVTDTVFEDNTKSWSGDHCVNPPDVPGILFSNFGFKEETPSIMDIGPTVLDLFGVPVPNYCDGRPLMPAVSQQEDHA
jgi:predicted AlkP superfamily phosphohydrolase/phosphomutase